MVVTNITIVRVFLFFLLTSRWCIRIISYIKVVESGAKLREVGQNDDRHISAHS